MDDHRNERVSHGLQPFPNLNRMRPVNRVAAGVALTAALIVGLAACSETHAMATGDIVGQSLDLLNRTAPQDVSSLIQDASPRVGKVISFNLTESDPKQWIVVAVCADEPDLNKARAIEMAIIPKSTYSASVKADVKNGSFLDAVACDDLPYR